MKQHLIRLPNENPLLISGDSLLIETTIGELICTQ